MSVIDGSPIAVTNRHTVTIRCEVTVDATATVSFTDDDVRGYFEMEPRDEITRKHIDEYAQECDDLDPTWDLGPESEYEYGYTTVDSRTSEQVTVVPPEFVPLPGLEGDLGT